MSNFCTSSTEMLEDNYPYNRTPQQTTTMYREQICIKEEIIDDQWNDNYDTETPMTPEVAQFTCDICKESFKSEQLYQTHVQHCCINPYVKTEPDCDVKPIVNSNSEATLNEVGYTETVLNIYTDPTLNDKQRIACEFCGMKYKNRENLQKHMEKTGCDTQERIESIQCSTCGISFATRSNLTRHQKRTGCVQKEDVPVGETDVERFPALKPDIFAQRLPNRLYCDTCGLSYKSRSNLMRHQKKSGCRQAKRGLFKEKLNSDILKMRSESTIKTEEGCKPDIPGTVMRIKEEFNDSNVKSEPTHLESNFRPAPNSLLVSNSNTIQFTNPQSHFSEGPNVRPEITCDLCNRSFENVKRLYSHADTHEIIPLVLQGDMEFLKCKFCLKQFTDHIERKAHEGTHTGDKPYECPHCQQKFVRNRNLMHHMRIHTGELPFQCESCLQVFRDKRYLTRHIERNHLQVERLACGLCETKVYDKVQLALHTRKHIDGHTFACRNCGKTKQCTANQEQVEEKPPEIETDASDEHSDHESNVPNNPDLFCDLCSRYFNDKDTFFTHAETHETIPIALKDDVSFRQCKFCYKEFPTHIERKTHEATHKRKRPYECPICRKRFICDLSRKIHIRTHSGPVIFECEQCSKSFKDKSGLKRHIRRKHLKIRKVVCDLCDQRFFDRVALAIHMLSHIKEGNYICKTCKNCTPKNVDK